MGNDVIMDHLLMIYDKVIKIDGYDIYGVLLGDKKNIITKDGQTIFKENHQIFENNKNYIKLITQDFVNNTVKGGIYFKETGCLIEVNDMKNINDVGDYLLVTSDNKKELKIINNKTGELIMDGQINSYRVRMGDKKTPICITSDNGEKMALSNFKVRLLEEHLENNYDNVKKNEETNGYYVTTTRGNNYELNKFGQRY